ncbi:hypothetical protein ABPG72_020044 [Tetrahymena utriculariae]
MTLSEFELGKLITLKQQGYSGWVVQQRLKEIDVEISINQINLLFRKWERQGGRKIDRRGRANLFNEELIEKIKQRIRVNRTTTAVDIQKSKTLNPNGASVRCVQYLLKEIGFNCRKSPSRPMLSDQNVDRRYEFALDMSEWSQNEIRQILFSNECKIFCQKRGNSFLRVNKGYKVQKQLFTQTQKNHGGKEIMVWAIISNNGPLRIVQIEGLMNSEKYLSINQDFYSTQNINQFDQNNQSPNKNQSHIKQNIQQPSSEFKQYEEILNSTSQHDLPSEVQNFSNQIPSTLMSSTYIQEKDKQETDKQKYIQNQMKVLFGDEQQQDMKWSQNIKSNYMQWKQTRDGKNQSNIHPNSEEPTKQSPLNSIEQQEVIDQSKVKLLYDWKKIYKSKAYRNDTLQNFISYQSPQLNFYNNLKVFNLATDYFNKDTYTQETHEYISEIEKLKNKKQAIGILNIFYNKKLLDKSLEEYTDTELSEHSYNATESPEKSHIFKMVEIIDRYIKNLAQLSLETKIKNSENQKIIISDDQKSDNLNAIIDAMRNIIFQNNTNPYTIDYTTEQGIVLTTFFSDQSIDWGQVYISQEGQ